MQKTITLFLLFTLAFSTALSFSGNGSGTEEDPYQITNVHQLQEMKDDLMAHYILMNDIDASKTREWNVGDHDGDPETPDSAMGFEPVGNRKQNDYNLKSFFSGSLNGYGFSINKLFINRPNQDFVGLFGNVIHGVNIYNMLLSEVDITGRSFVGGLVGEIISNGKDVSKIEKCIVTGKISGLKTKFGECIGGLVGCVNDITGGIEISNCMSDAYVYGFNYVGGFCGKIFSQAKNRFTSIIHCLSKGVTKGHGSVGGFIGSNISINNKSIIRKCYNKSLVAGIAAVGGFCGINENATISECYNTGDIVALNYDNTFVSVGGFCATNISINNSSYIYLIENCYNIGNIVSETERFNTIAGFLSRNKTKNNYNFNGIRYCYTVSNINMNITYQNVGGFCAWHEGPGSHYIEDCYWNLDNKNIDTSYGGKRLSTKEMANIESYENWDFEDIWSIDPDINNGFPYLRDMPEVHLEKKPKITINDISLFPNPSIDIITISSNLIIGKDIRIFDLLGQLVWQGKATDYNFDIDISSLARNVYILRIEEETLMFVKN
jgi:hypothetical protein